MTVTKKSPALKKALVEAALIAGVTASIAKAPVAKAPAKPAAKATKARGPLPAVPGKTDTVTPPADAKAAGKATRKAATPAAKKPKPAPEAAVKFVARTVKPGTPVHAIAEDARPVSGSRLYAHTHAALALLGMLAEGRPAVPQRAALTVLGQRAVSYHLKKQNMEHAPNHGVRLTISGRNTFINRLSEGKVNGGLANSFLALFIEGKADAATGVASGKVYSTMLPA